MQGDQRWLWEPPGRCPRCPGSPLPGGAGPAPLEMLARKCNLWGRGGGGWRGHGEREKDRGGGMEARGWSWRDEAGAGSAAAGGLWHWGGRRTHGGCGRHRWGAGVGDAGNSWRGGTFLRSPKLHGASWGQRGGWKGWQGRRKTKGSGLALPLARGSPSGAPTTLPTPAQPHRHPGLQGPAHGGCQGGPLW